MKIREDLYTNNEHKLDLFPHIIYDIYIYIYIYIYFLNFPSFFVEFQFIHNNKSMKLFLSYFVDNIAVPKIFKLFLSFSFFN